ncbi:MAG: carbohydrate-binding domain-containing protein, partial [Limisphaerales bacterium]
PNSGIFKPITGDIDFLAILNLDGSVPGLFKRLRVYRKMIAEGLQHGESFSFFMKELREGWLRCCSPTTRGGEGERMLAATPSGQLLTTQFVDDLSVIEGGANNALKVGEGEFAFFAGTMSEIHSAERLASETIPAALRRDAVPYVSVSALARMVEELDAEIERDGGVPVRMGPDGQPEIYSPEPATDPTPGPALLHSLHAKRVRPAAAGGEDEEIDAELARLLGQGWVPERDIQPPGASGGQWRPATAAEVRTGPAGAGIRIAPYTYLVRDLAAGESILPVMSASDLGLPSGSPFFAVGDVVVIDPGGPAEEFATLASIHPFTLSHPLRNLQEVGTTVLFLSGVAEPDKVPGALPARENLLVWLRADAGLSLTDGTNVISWTDQSRNGFVFAAPTEVTRPEWVANSTSGVPAVRFAAASNPRLQANLGRTLTNATIFTLARWVDTSNGHRYVYAFGTRDYSGLMMTLARRDRDQAYHYDGAAERFADNTIPGTDLRVFTQVFGEGGPDRHRLSVDLRTVLDTRTTVGRAYSAVATNVVLGNYVTGSYGFVGDLVEWLVYDRVLSVEERLEVEEYLSQRAGRGPFVTPGSLDLSASEILDYDVAAAPVGSWSLDMANRQLIQTGVGDPSLALSGFAEAGQVIRAKISADAGSGALGVVFGYEHRGSFLLFDWRQATGQEADWGTASTGMRLRSFHPPEGQDPTGADFWSGLDPNRVTTWRTNTLPWVAGREYDVVIRLGEDQTVVEVRFGASMLETWIVPELRGITGQFGHYAYGLSHARFGPVVLPGAVPLITAIEVDDVGRSTVRWMNGAPPFVVESTADLSGGAWYPVTPATPNYSSTLQSEEETMLFRVRSAGVVPDGDIDGTGGRSQTFGNDGGLWRVDGSAPTRIEAENFDEGGEGVAYHETTAQNQGGAYRAEAVDVYATGDFGGGHTVASIVAGEWLEYTIRVEQAGAYRLRARTARGQSGNRTVRFLFNGEDKTGSLVVPPTGDWESYATVESEAFELTAGAQILRADLGGGGFNLNWIEIVPARPVVRTTFGNNGQPWAIGSTTATRIEAENFDEGGQGLAYHETTPQNAGGAYRAEAVDVFATTDSGGGHTVAWTAVGEWLDYTIRVEQAGSYRLRARAARGQSGARTVRFLFDGVDKTGNLVIPATGNWEAYTTVESGRFDLAAGQQTLRMDVTSADFNLNWVEIVPVVPVARTTFGNDGNPWLVTPAGPVRIEAENFDEGGPDVAYLDADSINQGGAYRSEDVDLQPTTDTGGGFNVLAIEPGEWLEYTIDVQAAGAYQFRFRTARSPAGSRALRVLVAGVDKTGSVTIPRTVGWQTWTTVTKTGVSLDPGIQTLRIQTDVGGFNLNWVEIAPE